MFLCAVDAPPLDLSNLAASVVKPSDVYLDMSHSLKDRDEDPHSLTR